MTAVDTEKKTSEQQSRFNLTPEQAEKIRRDPPHNMTVPEGAAYLTLGVRTMWERIDTKKIKVVRDGERVILRRSDLDAYLTKLAR